MKLNKSIILAGLLVANIASAASLEDRVSELEAQQSLNILSFSGYLWNRWDGVTTENWQAATSDYADAETFNNLRMGFGMNINANISSRLKFYSRLGARKYYNIWYGPNSKYTSELGGLDAGSDKSISSTLTLDKAYFDYNLSENLIWSMGRLPTVDGTPVHLWDAQARMGTYPMMSYNNILDGYAFTYKLDRFLPEGHKLAFRFIQTPFSILKSTSSSYPNLVGQDHATAGGGTLNVPSLTATNTVHLDYNIAANSVAKATNVIWQSWSAKWRFPDAFNATGNSSLSIDATVSTLSIELNGLMGTDLDLAVNSVNSSIKSEGKYCIAAACAASWGFGTTDTTQAVTTKGSMTSISARYKIMSKTYLGYDSSTATKGFFFYDAAGVEVTDWFITPGTMSHFYLTQKLEDNLTLRIGMANQASKWTRINIGAISDDKTKVSTTYAQLRLDF